MKPLDAAPTTLRGDEVKVLLHMMREETRRSSAVSRTPPFLALYRKVLGLNTRIEERRAERAST